jgi:hypothetical protein
LFEQITVRAVQFDPVEISFHRILPRLSEFFDRSPDVGLCHRLWHAIRLHSLVIGAMTR